MNSLDRHIVNATKWSAITEIAAKLVLPIINMILARILAPDAFGIVATVTLVISFADIFADSGFQKYLIQRKFLGDDEKFKNANVAFWSNLLLSAFLWLLIFCFRDNIALFVGNPGLGNVLAVASTQLIFTPFSSIQTALFRRNLDFRTLFYVRLVAILIPFVITIPLALIGMSYWAIIIGNLMIQVSNAVILTIKSEWKPKLFFSFKILKKMYSFSIWSLIESISIWLTIWIDAFIIGTILNEYYLGLYRTSTTMVNMLMGLITSTVIPVLFSALSKLQSDDDKFNELYFKFQKITSIFIFPLGIGVFLFSDLATFLMLGNKWSEASNIIGVWALTSSIMIVFGHFSSEVYRAKGKPKMSLFAQVLHLIFLVPTILISSNYGFWILVYARSWIRMQFVLVHLFIMKYFIKIPIYKIIKNVFSTFLAALTMGIFGYSIQQFYSSVAWNLFSIFVCILFYFSVLIMFPTMRRELITLSKKLLTTKFSYKSLNMKRKG